MCLGKPECQRCETCGMRKWQFWMDDDMHPRGCPWGAATMDKCQDVINHARASHHLATECPEVKRSPVIIAMIEVLQSAGVDMEAKPDWSWQPD